MMGDFIKEALVTRDAEATAAMVLTICSYALVGPIKASQLLSNTCLDQTD